MTPTLREGATYRTRDGRSIGPICKLENPGTMYDRDWVFTADNIPPDIKATAKGQGLVWRADGTFTPSRSEHDLDLVEEVSTDPNGPVRQVTTTRTTIVSGDYARIRIALTPREPEVWIGLLARTNPDVPQFVPFDANELDGLARTATRLAAALRQIAQEQTPTE